MLVRRLSIRRWMCTSPIAEVRAAHVLDSEVLLRYLHEKGVIPKSTSELRIQQFSHGMKPPLSEFFMLHSLLLPYLLALIRAIEPHLFAQYAKWRREISAAETTSRQSASRSTRS